MSKSIETRPPQVTFAGTVVIAAAVMVMMAAWERVGGLRTIETRDTIDEFLTGPGSSLGIGRETALGILQVSAVLAAVLAAAACILGWHVIKGDKSARLALSMAAGAMFAVAVVPMFLTGVSTAGFSTSLVAASAVMLWMEPAREWFATGRWTPPPPREAPERPEPGEWHQGPAARQAPHQGSDPQGPDPQGPAPHGAPTDGAGPPPHPTPYASSGMPPPPQGLGHPPPPVGAHYGPPPQRPSALTTAFVLTVVSTVVVAVFATLAMVVVGVAPDMVMAEFERQNPDGAPALTITQIRASTFVTGAVCVLACLIALVFAGLAMRRSERGRRGWLMTAAGSAGACLVVVITSPAALTGLVALFPATAAVVTVLFLRRPDVRRWVESAPPRRPRG